MSELRNLGMFCHHAFRIRLQLQNLLTLFQLCNVYITLKRLKTLKFFLRSFTTTVIFLEVMYTISFLSKLDTNSNFNLQAIKENA